MFRTFSSLPLSPTVSVQGHERKECQELAVYLCLESKSSLSPTSSLVVIHLCVKTLASVQIIFAFWLVTLFDYFHVSRKLYQLCLIKYVLASTCCFFITWIRHTCVKCSLECIKSSSCGYPMAASATLLLVLPNFSCVYGVTRGHLAVALKLEEP